MPRARKALSLAEFGLEKLTRSQDDEQEFRFLVPYVLDLAAAVTRIVDYETKGSRTPSFASWWFAVDRNLTKAITDLRNAELKRQEQQTSRHIEVTVSSSLLFTDQISGIVLEPDGEVRPVRGTPEAHAHVEQPLAGFSASHEWVFRGGPLEGRSVTGTIEEHLLGLREEVVPTAERLMDP